MSYSEAIKYKYNNGSLVSTSMAQGFKVGKILIVPSDENDRDKFLRTFLCTSDEDFSIAPFIDVSVEVWAVDMVHLNQNNVLFHMKLA